MEEQRYKIKIDDIEHTFAVSKTARTKILEILLDNVLSENFSKKARFGKENVEEIIRTATHLGMSYAGEQNKAARIAINDEREKQLASALKEALGSVKTTTLMGTIRYLLEWGTESNPSPRTLYLRYSEWNAMFEFTLSYTETKTHIMTGGFIYREAEHRWSVHT